MEHKKPHTLLETTWHGTNLACDNQAETMIINEWSHNASPLKLYNGRLVSLYRIRKRYFGYTQVELLYKGNPLKPQSFHQLQYKTYLRNTDYLVGQCIYENHNNNRTIHYGQTVNSELCTIYIMYLSVDNMDKSIQKCWNNNYPTLTRFTRTNDVNFAVASYYFWLHHYAYVLNRKTSNIVSKCECTVIFCHLGQIRGLVNMKPISPWKNLSASRGNQKGADRKRADRKNSSGGEQLTSCMENDINMQH
ncbi:unnamed protein product [Didymodactylos carnosus]|uniref:Copper type II ascorbate-dependent monooxygenase C-terminal domain-containing protein n=1 Tax=Didymodactylos carnosus TaxID=1234261 RepID=A0A814K8P5_9BILA|nr:unnamed protein product [Didymodactylos carnosus]CAF3817455.1 unnamed protein product [Didymodactylos carnosus]